MTMLLLVFQPSLDHNLQPPLKDLDVKCCTEVLGVFGTGEDGSAFRSMPLLYPSA